MFVYTIKHEVYCLLVYTCTIKRDAHCFQATRHTLLINSFTVFL